MRTSLIIILTTLFFLPITAKKPKKPAPLTPPTQVERIGVEQSKKYRYFYIEAVRQQDMEHYAAALELFRHCLDIDPEASEAHYSIARFYGALRMDSLARHHYERAVALEPQNGEFLESLGQFYLSQNEISTATELYERISRQYPDRTELLEVLLQIYQHERNYPLLLSTLERIETAEGQSESLTLSKMNVYTQMGDEDGAYNALISLVNAYPNDLNYKVMMGNWSLAHSHRQEALETFLAVLGEEPDHAQAQMSLMDYYRSDGNEARADSLLYTILENPRTEPQTRITMMRQVIKDNEQAGRDSTRILNIFRRVLSLPQKTNEMASMQVAYMEFLDMPRDSVRNALIQVLDITPEEVSARLKYIGILWEDSVGANVIAECRKAIDYNPKETVFYYYLGLAQYLNEKEPEALSTFQSGVATFSDETTAHLRATIYMLMGDIYHQLGNPSKAYEAYDSCLIYNPDEVACLNNYAYYLSVEGKDLEKAAQMSYKTITAEPRNATYLDTYAWILYMQKRYEEARIYIDQTLRADSDTVRVSAAVLEHAGDIYQKVGEYSLATGFYERALSRNPDNAALIRRKIAQIKKK